MSGRSRWSWWQRVAAACLATWFAVMTADPLSMHACPMHEPLAAAAIQMASAASASTADHGTPGRAVPATASHAEHAAPTAATAMPQDDAPSHDADHACTCLGHCCAASAAFAAASPTIDLVTALATPTRPTGRPAHEYVAGWVDFVLPFATAPPARALA